MRLGVIWNRTCILGIVKPAAKRAAGKADPLTCLHVALNRRVVSDRINRNREVDIIDTTRKFLRTSLWWLVGRAARAVRPVTPARALRWLKIDTGGSGRSECESARVRECESARVACASNTCDEDAGARAPSTPPRGPRQRHHEGPVNATTRRTYQCLGERGD